MLFIELGCIMLLFHADMREMSDGLNHLQSILSTLPHAVIVLMRYLFAFLNQYVHFFSFNTDICKKVMHLTNVLQTNKKELSYS